MPILKQHPIINELLKKEPALFSFLKTGDLVEGKILKKEGNRKLFVDLGRYGTGVVYGAELLNAKDEIKNLKIGDPLQAKVINPENEEGYIELSLSEANRQKAWDEIMEMKEQELIIKAKPKSFNTGGLIFEINGLTAFLPISQISLEHYLPNEIENKNQITNLLQKLISQELSIKIIDVNPRNKKIILSEKEAVQINIKELIKNYQIGQVIEGIVSSITDFGIFIRFTDNPQIEGLIQASEISHKILENPKEIVKIDQIIKAKIIDIKDGKIFLSLKALMPDPWEKSKEVYQEKQIVKGKVYSFNPFGAIINLDYDLQGQVHVTEFGSIEEMKKQLKIGEEYSFLIESIKPQEKRITLKFKNIDKN